MRYVKIKGGWNHSMENVAYHFMTNTMYIGLSVVVVLVLFGL